jgi:cobalt-zinc-cadmium efflux system membrane fusion protein
MKSTIGAQCACLFALSLSVAGCGTHADPTAEAPPPAHVEHEQDLNVVKVDHPEQFSLATAGQRAARSQLVVTGTVSPDVSRTVPVVSIATGRVVEIKARLGDTVQKGQVLMRVQSSDIAGAFSDYRKAVTDEALARTQLDRAKDLYAHGAIALNDLQVAQDAEDKAKVDVETTSEHLRLLGSDLEHPTGFVDIVAPVSGVITEQQVTNAGGVQGLGSNLMTISDLSYIWVLGDVHENDLPSVRVGETADIRLNAYPGQVFKGTINNIGAVLDPNIRTAKVRIEVRNPGLMRIGMFVTATFHGMTEERRAVVPASAILHLHDRDWVFVPAGAGQFRRTEVTAGEMLPNNLQEIISGIQAGQQVVNDALALENTAAQ